MSCRSGNSNVLERVCSYKAVNYRCTTEADLRRQQHPVCYKILLITDAAPHLFQILLPLELWFDQLQPLGQKPHLHTQRVRDTPSVLTQTHYRRFKVSTELCTCLSLSLSFLSVFSSTSCRCSTFLSISSLCSLTTVSSWPSYTCKKNTQKYIFYWDTIHKELMVNNYLQIVAFGTIYWTLRKKNSIKESC